MRFAKICAICVICVQKNTYWTSTFLIKHRNPRRCHRANTDYSISSLKGFYLKNFPVVAVGVISITPVALSMAGG